MSHWITIFYFISWFQIFLWLYPEILMVISSIVIFVVLQNLALGRITPPEGEEPTPLSERPDYDAGLSPDKLGFCIGVAKILSIITLLFAAVFHPSAINGIYFVIFLGAATWWACAKELERGFGIVLRCTLVIFVLHITTFMVYQSPWPQEFVDSNSTVARVLGYTPLITSKCAGNVSDSIPSMAIETVTEMDSLDLNGTEPKISLPEVPEDEIDLRVLLFNKFNADYYLNPLCLILCYYTIAITSSLLLGPKVN